MSTSTAIRAFREKFGRVPPVSGITQIFSEFRPNETRAKIENVAV